MVPNLFIDTWTGLICNHDFEGGAGLADNALGLMIFFLPVLQPFAIKFFSCRPEWKKANFSAKLSGPPCPLSDFMS